jgi:hypothetical protein
MASQKKCVFLTLISSVLKFETPIERVRFMANARSKPCKKTVCF